jgi:CubicO group peptidase (beta-lactamase class C family)
LKGRGGEVLIQNIAKLDSVVEPLLRAGRIPGAAIAVVANGETVVAKGYGYRDLAGKLPMSSKTVYPIASTTKAMNATLLGMLVDEGTLAWDVPVQQYLPEFRLFDSVASAHTTLRDLVTMRTGLPRHDWVWLGSPMSSAELVDILRYLEPSAGFRERFQYNNIGVTTAGHIAAVVTGVCWEELLRQKLLDRLGMINTDFKLPAAEDVALSYFENSRRELIPTARLASEATGPSGGTIHSTVEDMAKWVAFNLSSGMASGRQLIKASTLGEIHSAQVMTGADPAPPTPNAAYAMGWFVDTYNGCKRVSHGGYLHDVSSDVMLVCDQRIGVVSFTNFGPSGLARLLNEHTIDLLKGSKPVQAVEEKLALYERKIEENRERCAAVRRVTNTVPSHRLVDYVGTYGHPAYGKVEINLSAEELVFRWNQLTIPLAHWHYDAWVPRDEWFVIHAPHAFDRSSRFLFETSADGDICSVSIRLEPAVAAIRFAKAH